MLSEEGPMKGFVLTVAATSLVSLFASGTAAASSNCDALAGARLTDTTITSAASMPAGSFTPPAANSRPIPNLPAFCAVHGVIKPTPTSAIQFEAWLPESNWNGRLQVVGN